METCQQVPAGVVIAVRCSALLVKHLQKGQLGGSRHKQRVKAYRAGSGALIVVALCRSGATNLRMTLARA